VARNVVAEHRRRASREAGVIAKLSGRALVDADAYADLEARIDAEATARRLYEAMRAPSERERAVMELVALEQIAVAEAAAVLGIRAGTARARLARARRRLRGLLGPLDEDRPGPAPPILRSRWSPSWGDSSGNEPAQRPVRRGQPLQWSMRRGLAAPCGDRGPATSRSRQLLVGGR
jgi:Sigma-70, region 4